MSDTRLDDAISRLTAWIRDFGPEKNQVFIEDLTQVIEAARVFRNGKPADKILLSDELLKNFAAALANTPLPPLGTEICSQPITAVAMPPGHGAAEYDAMPPLVTMFGDLVMNSIHDPDLQTPPDMV